MDLAVINVFDKNMDFIGRINKYESLIYVRKWQTYGDFEIHVAKANPELFKSGNLIMLNNDFERCGVIQKNNDDEYYKKREVVVKGYSLLFLLTNRLTVPPTNEGYRTFNNAAVEDVIYSLVQENMIDRHPIKGLKLGENKHRGDKITFQTRYKVLADEVETLCGYAGLGARITMNPDNKEFIFEVVEGIDRSPSDGIPQNEPYVFSKRLRNVKNRNYSHDSSGSKTTAYVAGQGEGENREVIILHDDLTGIERKEVFIDARDVEKGDDTTLADRGELKLKGYQASDTFTFEVMARDYRTKWDLGDIVGFEDTALDFFQTNRIVEIQETYENGTIEIEPTFGDVGKTIVDVVKSTSEDIKTETRTAVSGGLTEEQKKKLDGIAEGATKTEASKSNGNIKINGVDVPVYDHPDFNKRGLGLYKVEVNNGGHVSNVLTVSKDDITALGIPKQDTTYSVFNSNASGLTPASGGGTTRFLRADGTWQTPPTGTNGNKVTVSTSQPSSPKIGDIWI